MMNLSNETTQSTLSFDHCLLCQISYGFTADDRRAIIIMVVLVAIALIGCYTGVLWFAFRTRFRPEKDENIEMNHSYVNEGVKEDEEERDEPAINTSLPTTITTSNEKLEKF